MKITCLLFLSLIVTMSWAALMPGTGYAAPSQQTSAESSATDSPLAGTIPPRNKDLPRHASDKNHPRSRASLTAANRPKQLPNSRKRSIPGNAMNLHQPGSDKSGGAAKGGLIQNETVSNALPVRPPSIVRLRHNAQPSLNNVRHRGPNPAVVGGSAGGSANLDSSNTGAINGTRMHRKP